MPFYGGTKRVLLSAPSDPFLPGIDAFASLPRVKASTLPNRTVTTSQLAGANTVSAPLQYNVLTINTSAGLNVDNSTYSAIFVRANVLKFIGGTGFLNANGGDGGTPGCAQGGNGGNGASGGGAGAGPICPSYCSGFPGNGGSGVNGTDSDVATGGLGLGHIYSGAYGFLSGGASCGICSGPGFGAGGNAAGSEVICPGCPCGGCGPIPPTYGGSGGGGAGAGMIYGQFNLIMGLGRFFANGGFPGLNQSGNLFSNGGGGGVVDIASVHKTAGTLTPQTNGGPGSGDGQSRIRQILPNGSTTNQTFGGSW